MTAHLGGCTGDTLGATVEVVEAVTLVAAASGL
ncbi:MAG: adenosylcobinamide-GDP ribazoletransferase [Gammaproteobacteria bacterium]